MWPQGLGGRGCQTPRRGAIIAGCKLWKGGEVTENGDGDDDDDISQLKWEVADIFSCASSQKFTFLMKLQDELHQNENITRKEEELGSKTQGT